MRFALQQLQKELAERFPQASNRLPPAGVLPTGLAELDALLPGGGLPRGCLVELEGPASSGKGALVDRMAAALTVSGGRVGYIDLPRTLYPPAMASAGARLDKLLVVRPVALPQALWACELLVRCQGFELLVLDLCSRNSRPVVPPAPLHRLSRVAEQGPAVVLFLTESSPGPERVLPGGVTALRLTAERAASGPSVRVARSRW